MKNIRRIAIILGTGALIGGCQGPCSKIDLGAPAVQTANVDFSRYVAVGTSISAGYQSGGMVDRHQINSYPAIFARQIGKTVQLNGQGSFSEPTVDGNGAPPLLRLVGLSPRPDIQPIGPAGTPNNTTWPSPYSNLAIPGAILFDFNNAARYVDPGFGPAATLVLRNLGTVQAQLLAQQPTFVSFEFGANEVLGPATRGSSKVGNAPTNVATYTALLGAAIGAIHAANPAARIAIANVPDVTTIPFFTTVSSAGLYGRVHRIILAPSPNAGRDTISAAALTSGDLVTLPASRALALGIGTSLANPLDSTLVLDEAERAVIAGTVQAMNAAVDVVARPDYIAKIDFNGALGAIRQSGIDIGGTHYSDAFLTGGLFSLDGVHPTDLGHAIVANAMITAVNERFGTRIPYARLGDYATTTSSSVRLASGEAGANIPGRFEGIDEVVDLLGSGWRH